MVYVFMSSLFLWNYSLLTYIKPNTMQLWHISLIKSPCIWKSCIYTYQLILTIQLPVLVLFGYNCRWSHHSSTGPAKCLFRSFRFMGCMLLTFEYSVPLMRSGVNRVAFLIFTDEQLQYNRGCYFPNAKYASVWFAFS